MKTLRIYKREVTERTGFSKFRFKSTTQYVVAYDGHEYRNGHQEEVDNYKLRIRFSEILNTRRKGELNYFLTKLSKTNADKWLKQVIESHVQRIRIAR